MTNEGVNKTMLKALKEINRLINLPFGHYSPTDIRIIADEGRNRRSAEGKEVQHGILRRH